MGRGWSLSTEFGFWCQLLFRNRQDQPGQLHRGLPVWEIPVTCKNRFPQVSPNLRKYRSMHSIHCPGSVFLIARRRSSDQTTATAPTMDALSQPGMFCGRGHRATAPAARLATLLATPLHAPALLRLRRFGDATDLAPCDREAHAQARFGLEADPAPAARSTILVVNSGAHGRSHAHAHSGSGGSALATSAPLPVSQ